ncbi:MAG: UvrD-helicase domain-containing protein [Psychroflexus halocasei]
MAILEPKLEVIKKQKVQPTEGEWTILNFLLEELDNTYEIFYQPFLNGDNPDFAIMRKGSGVLLLEVKDWVLDHYYCDKSTKWRLMKDDAFIKSPLSQVETYKNNLFQLHSEELFQRSVKNKNNWATVNCAVYFHNATEERLRSFLLDDFKTENYRRYTKFVNYFGLLGKNSLNSNNLNNLFSRFWLNRQSYYFDEILYNSIRRYLKSPLHQIEEGIKINYTKEQNELIRSEIRPRRKVKGVAGSGKTLVLAKRAVNAHIRTGEKVLVLTYNLSLKNYIHDRISDVREEFYWSNFYITNYHQFFKAQANNHNLEISNLSVWQDVNFFENAKDSIQKYDVVLIDEIQDYLQSWIDIITKYFTHEETEFVVFGDEKQNIYGRKLDENNEPIVRTIPGVWNKTLNTSHRFSSNIGNIAIKFQKTIFNQKYNHDEINVMSQFDFEKRVIEYHSFQSYSPEELFQIVYQVLERNEIHSSDAGILCSKVELLREIDLLIRTKKKEKTATTFESQEEFEEIKGDVKKIEKLRRTKKNHFWMKTGTIKLSTTHSFKGWEINTLFLFIEPEEDDSEFTNAELVYTALTRAKMNLIIFNLGNKKYDGFFRGEIQNCYEHQRKNGR